MSAKHKGIGPQALTANELRGGLNMWMTSDFTWSSNFDDALTTEDPAIIEKMRDAGAKDEDANRVVGVYFIDIEAETGLPARYREKFRVTGPTHDRSNYPEAAGLEP